VGCTALEPVRRRTVLNEAVETDSWVQVYKGLRSSVQDVAVKVLTISEELEMQQFWVEINLLKSLSYDRNIVQVRSLTLPASPRLLPLPLVLLPGMRLEVCRCRDNEFSMRGS
jgi:hypothetical protein